jgi:predicted small metal-binding protein
MSWHSPGSVTGGCGNVPTDRAPSSRHEPADRRKAEVWMSKSLECGVIVPGCRFVIRGETEDDVVVKAASHLHQVHNVGHVSEQLRARIRDAIGDAAKEPAGNEGSGKARGDKSR